MSGLSQFGCPAIGTLSWRSLNRGLLWRARAIQTVEGRQNSGWHSGRSCAGIQALQKAAPKQVRTLFTDVNWLTVRGT